MYGCGSVWKAARPYIRSICNLPIQVGIIIHVLGAKTGECVLFFRFIKRYLLPEALPMLSSHTLFHILAEPLRTVLRGQFFTAVLVLSSPQVAACPQKQNDYYDHDMQRMSINRKYIASKFNFVGERPIPTVYSILCNDLSEMNYSQDLALLPDLVNDKTKHCQRKEEGLSSEESSIFSCVSSSGSQQSRKITFESYTQSVVDSSSTNLSNDVCYRHPSSYSFCHKASENGCTPNSHFKLSGSSVKSTQIVSPYTVFNSMIPATPACVCIEDEWSDGWTEEGHVSLCQDILEELMSTWEEGELQKKRSSLNVSSSSFQIDPEFTETLPDSESFFDEFQCDFEPTHTTTSTLQREDPTPSSLSTTHTQHNSRLSKHNSSLVKSRLSHRPKTSVKHCLSPLCLEINVHSQQFTPELFSSMQESIVVPDTNHVGECNLSPELFSSPLLVKATPPMPASVSTDLLVKTEVSDVLCGDKCTPLVGQHTKSLPKRRLLHPLHNSLDIHTSCEHEHKKTLINEDNVTDTIFSPELFP